MLKKCKRCGLEKYIDAFAIRMGNGSRDGSCKECRKIAELLMNRRLYKKKPLTEERKKKALLRARVMQKKYPEKYKARRKVYDAVRRGKMQRLPCEVCGDPKSQGHHVDYSKPLEVKWLCAKHHGLEHRIPITKEQEEMILRTAQVAHKDKTHCIRGHELTTENLAYETDGSRICVTCRRMHSKLYYKKFGKKYKTTPKTNREQFQRIKDDPEKYAKYRARRRELYKQRKSILSLNENNKN